MPFTVCHLAAAAPAKALGKRCFSIKLFFATQAMIDTEPGVGMLFDVEPIHGFFHTWSGSLVPAALAVLAWRVLAGMSIWRFRIDTLSWPVCVASALYGAWSHVWLDGLMHVDMHHFQHANEAWAKETCAALVAIGTLIAAFTYGVPALLRLVRRLST